MVWIVGRSSSWGARCNARPRILIGPIVNFSIDSRRHEVADSTVLEMFGTLLLNLAGTMVEMMVTVTTLVESGFGVASYRTSTGGVNRNLLEPNRTTNM